VNRWVYRILGAVIVIALLLFLYGMQRTLQSMVDARGPATQR
jgi:hypothetical protein